MFALAMAIGVIMAIQSAVNAQLRIYVGSAYVTSWVSFTVALPFLIIMTYVTGASLGFPLTLFETEPFYIWIGGLCGAVALMSNVLLFPVLGSVQTAILPIVGMTIMGMLIDHNGWFQVPHYAFGWARFAGLLLVLTGVVLVVYRKKAVVVSTNRQWLWRLLGIVGGLLLAIQVAVNGRLSTVLHSAPHAAFISFFVGMLTLACIVVVTKHSFRQVLTPFREKAPWWIFLGGILGGTFVLANAYLAGVLGTGQTVVFALFGQMTASVIVQQFGLFHSEKNRVRLMQIMGLVIIIVGVAMIQLL
ncbi:MAG: DMT family transporter [Candidatus Kurthia intestinigallinarum]